MNDYSFDYLNYITSIPQKYNQNQIIANNNILNPYQGYLKGNLFKNTYKGYKNYTPKEINANNEQEALLYQLMQYKFALIELNLYLDTNPNDTNALNLYNQYLINKKQIMNKYETMYGPITIDSNNTATTTWNWNNTTWPWEGK